MSSVVINIGQPNNNGNAYNPYANNPYANAGGFGGGLDLYSNPGPAYYGVNLGVLGVGGRREHDGHARAGCGPREAEGAVCVGRRTHCANADRDTPNTHC